MISKVKKWLERKFCTGLIIEYDKRYEVMRKKLFTVCLFPRSKEARWIRTSVKHYNQKEKMFLFGLKSGHTRHFYHALLAEEVKMPKGPTTTSNLAAKKTLKRDVAKKKRGRKKCEK